MFEKYVYLTLIKGGQEKENHSQQIPTFRCSEWSNFKDLHCEGLLLSSHRGYVAIMQKLSLILIGYFFEHVINFG